MGCCCLQPFVAHAGLVTGVGVVMTGGDGVVLVVESQEKEGGSGSIIGQCGQWWRCVGSHT